jgi:hypothetical protein
MPETTTWDPETTTRKDRPVDSANDREQEFLKAWDLGGGLGPREGGGQ